MTQDVPLVVPHQTEPQRIRNKAFVANNHSDGFAFDSLFVPESLLEPESDLAAESDFPLESLLVEGALSASDAFLYESLR